LPYEPAGNQIKSGESFSIENLSASLGEKVGRICEPIRVGNSQTPWAVMVNAPLSEVLEKANQIKYMSMGIGTAAISC